MAESCKTEGLLIRQSDFSETSRVVTFFTRDFGKITALAKGAKRLKGPFEAALDLLTQCQIVFLHKSTQSLDLLTEAKLVSRFRAQSRDVNVHYAGLYVAELLDSCTEPFDPAPDWYAAALLTLQRLQTSPDFRLPLLRFELFSLQAMGLLPEFDQCVCGQPVQANAQQWSVWIQQGVLLCSQCRRPESSSRPLTGEVLDWLRRLSQTDIACELDALPPLPSLKQMRPLMTALFSQALERRPQMLSYLQF